MASMVFLGIYNAYVNAAIRAAKICGHVWFFGRISIRRVLAAATADAQHAIVRLKENSRAAYNPLLWDYVELLCSDDLFTWHDCLE